MAGKDILVRAYGEGALDIMQRASRFKYARSTAFVHDVAPSFRASSRGIKKEMDKFVKAIIAPTTNVIANLSDKSCENLVWALSNTDILQQRGREKFRSATFTKRGTHVFKIHGSADQSIVREVKAWFNNLVDGGCFV